MLSSASSYLITQTGENMSADQKIQSIRESLYQKPNEFVSLQQKVDKLQYAEQSIKELPAVLDELNSTIERLKREGDFKQALDGYSKTLNQLAQENRQALAKIQALLTKVDNQSKQLTVTDAKYNRLISRIDAVLVGLEKLLR